MKDLKEKMREAEARLRKLRSQRNERLGALLRKEHPALAALLEQHSQTPSQLQEAA